MSLEHEIKEALMRRAGDVQERPAAFDGVEGKVRRAHRRRLAGAGALGVAAVIAAVVAVPRLLPDGEPDGFVGPPQPVPPTEELATYRNEQAGYQLRFPADWRVAGFEGSLELLPPGQVGLAAGEETFAFELIWFPGDRYDELPESVGEVPFTRSVVDEGRDAIEWGDAFELFLRADWTGAHCASTDRREPLWPCDSVATLQAHIFASNEDLYSEFITEAEAIAESIEPLTIAGYPETARVHTRHGELSAGVPYDGFAETLVEFLDARVDGIGTDAWYGGELPEGFIARYEVLERAEADANSVEFTVEVTGEETFIETIGVGPIGDDLGIRFVVRS